MRKIEPRRFPLSRRAFLGGATAGFALAAARPSLVGAASGERIVDYELTAAPGMASIVGDPYGDTAVWQYNGSLPGPEIRARQGDRLRVRVTNRLDEETTVHWHGLRLPNAMDGVPHLTQPPIKPGETFEYAFDLPDAGTFWYHPHQRSSAQVGRGLYGALIVEEPEPYPVDRDITWVLDDWRLTADVAIAGDFDNPMDKSHGGRLGNTVGINGRITDVVPVHPGERVRLRLVNAANARTFALKFEGHAPVVVALDGQPVTPHLAPGERVVLGAAMRADVILDMTGTPGERYRIVDDFFPRRAYRLADLGYADARVDGLAGEPVPALPANPLPEPELATAVRHEVRFGGGMMGAMTGARLDGEWRDIRTLMHAGKMWAINGVAASGPVMEPFLTIERGHGCVLGMVNDTAWHHPIHLHGHSFRVISRDGRPTVHREWRDTVLMNPQEKVEIAFVADNPGDWMFHCHILEHQAGGMMGVIRVT